MLLKDIPFFIPIPLNIKAFAIHINVRLNYF